MAFNASRFTRTTLAFNSGLVTLDGPTSTNGPAVFTYASSADTLATIAGANYFASVVYDLAVGDVLIVNGSNGSNMYIVATVDRDAGTVTVSSFTASGSVGTANIQDLAVTTAKIDDLAVTTGKIAANAVTSAKLALNTLQYTTVAITAAQFNGMYAAPKLLVAAGGADTLLVLQQLQLVMTYNSANYAAGGVAAVQYDSTINGAGVIASTTLSAATFQAAVTTTFTMNAGVVPLTASTTVNKGLYLSNITGAFTTGDSDMVAHIWYRVIPTV